MTALDFTSIEEMRDLIEKVLNKHQLTPKSQDTGKFYPAEAAHFLYDPEPEVGIFMTRIIAKPGYRNPKPDGITVEKVSGLLSSELGILTRLLTDEGGWLRAVGISFSGKLERFLPPASYRQNLTVTNRATTISQARVTALQPAPIPTLVEFYDYAKPEQSSLEDFTICLGIGENGPVWKSLYSLNNLLVGGAVDSGKSTTLYSICAQILLPEIFNPGQAQIALIDAGRATFNATLFEGLPHIYGGKVATTPEEIEELMNRLLWEVNRRSKLFEMAPGLPDKLQQYNRAVPERYRLPVLVVMIDEVSQLAIMLKDKLTKPLHQLAMTARKYGVYFILAGQDFKANTMPKTITEMCQTRLGFGNMSSQVLGVLGLERKPYEIKQGRGVLSYGGEIGDIQGLFLAKSDFVTIINQVREAFSLPPRGQGNLAAAETVLHELIAPAKQLGDTVEHTPKTKSVKQPAKASIESQLAVISVWQSLEQPTVEAVYQVLVKKKPGWTLEGVALAIKAAEARGLLNKKNIA
jgi:hypothetical protein